MLRSRIVFEVSLSPKCDDGSKEWDEKSGNCLMCSVFGR